MEETTKAPSSVGLSTRMRAATYWETFEIGMLVGCSIAGTTEAHEDLLDSVCPVCGKGASWGNIRGCHPSSRNRYKKPITAVSVKCNGGCEPMVYSFSRNGQ